jgi:hypothetical protein
MIRSDDLADLPSVTVLRITSDLHEWPLLRITVAPDTMNGLRVASRRNADRSLIDRGRGRGPSLAPFPNDCRRVPSTYGRPSRLAAAAQNSSWIAQNL